MCIYLFIQHHRQAFSYGINILIFSRVKNFLKFIKKQIGMINDKVLALCNNIELLRAVNKCVKSVLKYLLFNLTSRFVNVILFRSFYIFQV